MPARRNEKAGKGRATWCVAARSVSRSLLGPILGSATLDLIRILLGTLALLFDGTHDAAPPASGSTDTVSLALLRGNTNDAEDRANRMSMTATISVTGKGRDLVCPKPQEFAPPRFEAARPNGL